MSTMTFGDFSASDATIFAYPRSMEEFAREIFVQTYITYDDLY